MTVDARLADGTIMRFPDGTADDVVDRAVQTHMAARSPRAVPDLPRLIPGAGLQRAIMNGLMFGGRDEMAAGINSAVPGGGTYGEELTRSRAEDADYARSNPVSATAGNVLGGVIGPGIALRGAQPGANALSRFFRSAPSRGAVAGSTGGAATGFGEGEGLEGRLDGAASGGALGAAAGGVLGAGLNIGGRIAGRVMDVAGVRNADVAADRQVLRALSRDGVDPATLAARVQQAPPEAILADLGGRNTTGLAATASNVPGEAMQAADRAVQLRRAGAPDRIAQASDAAFGGGSGDDVAAALRTLQDTRATAARPLYERAFQIELNPAEYARVSRFVEDPIGQQAMRQGLRVIEIEHLARGEPFNPAAYGMQRVDGQLVPLDGVAPNMRLMDAVKRGFDEIVEGYRDTTTGRLVLDQFGRAVDSARGAYRNQLAGMFHPYRRALEAWSGPSQSMDAMNRGRQAFRVDRDALTTTADRLPAGDQDFLRLGAGRAVTDMASDPARAATTARRLTEDRQMQARIETLLPDEGVRRAFVAALEREMQTASTNAAISPRAGSQTARLQAGMDDMGIDPPGGMLASLLQGRVGTAVSQALSALYRRGQGINSSTADALAARLLSMDPAQNAATAARLAGRQSQDAAIAGSRQEALSRLLRGVGAAGAMDNR